MTEPGGRQVYAIALTAQVMIEPARRPYDAETRERLVELFGAAGALGHDDAQPASGTRPTCSCPPSPARPPSAWPSPASFDIEVAASKYLYGLPDGEVPLAFNFNGTDATTAATTGGCRCRSCRGAARPSTGCRSGIWRELIEHYYPRSGWIAAQHEARSTRCSAEKARRGLPTLDACVAELLEERP